MRKGIITEYTVIDKFDGTDIHKRDQLEPNTEVEVIGHIVMYGISYVKIKYNKNKIGFVDAQCIVEIQ